MGGEEGGQEEENGEGRGRNLAPRSFLKVGAYATDPVLIVTFLRYFVPGKLASLQRILLLSVCFYGHGEPGYSSYKLSEYGS